MTIYYDQRTGFWVSTDNGPVCQDHAQPMPCPHSHRGSTAPTRY